MFPGLMRRQAEPASAASIPLALSVADGQGRFAPGDVIVTEAIGGGLSWGSVVLRW